MQEQPAIRQWRVRTVRVPLAEPHNTASGTVAESPLVLTDVAIVDGHHVYHGTLEASLPLREIQFDPQRPVLKVKASF